MQEPRRWEHAGAWLFGGLLCWHVANRLLAREGAGSDAELWATLVSQGLWVCLAASGAVLARGESAAERLGLGPGRVRASSVVILVAGLLALSDGLSLILSALEVRHTGALGEVERMVAGAEPPPFLLALLCLGIAPGVGEEILFRGLIQRGLTRRLGPLAGVVLTAGIFAAAHLDPAQSPAAFLLGLYLGAVTQLAGSTRPAIACHVANNVLATAAARFGGLQVPGAAGLVAPVLLGAALGILVWVWRRETHRSPRGIQAEPESCSERADRP